MELLAGNNSENRTLLVREKWRSRAKMGKWDDSTSQTLWSFWPSNWLQWFPSSFWRWEPKHGDTLVWEEQCKPGWCHIFSSTNTYLTTRLRENWAVCKLGLRLTTKRRALTVLTGEAQNRSITDYNWGKPNKTSPVWLTDLLGVSKNIRKRSQAYPEPGLRLALPCKTKVVFKIPQQAPARAVSVSGTALVQQRSETSGADSLPLNT